MLEEPELVTLLPEEEEEPPPPQPKQLMTKIAVNLVVIVGLKVALGFSVRSLAKNIKQVDILYPEHLDRVAWKDF